jgi:hypothetical protein
MSGAKRLSPAPVARDDRVDPVKHSYAAAGEPGLLGVQAVEPFHHGVRFIKDYDVRLLVYQVAHSNWAWLQMREEARPSPIAPGVVIQTCASTISR